MGHNMGWIQRAVGRRGAGKECSSAFWTLKTLSTGRLEGATSTQDDARPGGQVRTRGKRGYLRGHQKEALHRCGESGGARGEAHRGGR